ncbi:MAG: ribosome biogenesis GTPase Der, partial [Candidatus Eremiobacteraeota bacterium]|nr:ribosome biogenesis GTPase Der [Candidatus Eremiobacteraeota bacterium]
LKIFYSAQPSVHPPLFVFHCNDPDLVRPDYERFIENTIRRSFDFEGVPLTLEFRRRGEERAVA